MFSDEGGGGSSLSLLSCQPLPARARVCVCVCVWLPRTSVYIISNMVHHLALPPPPPRRSNSRNRLAAGSDIAIAWSSDGFNPFLTKPRGENQRGAGNARLLNERGNYCLALFRHTSNLSLTGRSTSASIVSLSTQRMSTSTRASTVRATRLSSRQRCYFVCFMLTIPFTSAKCTRLVLTPWVVFHSGPPTDVIGHWKIGSEEGGKEAIMSFLTKVAANPPSPLQYDGDGPALWISQLCSHCCNYFLQGGSEWCKPYRQMQQRRAKKEKLAGAAGESAGNSAGILPPAPLLSGAVFQRLLQNHQQEVGGAAIVAAAAARAAIAAAGGAGATHGHNLQLVNQHLTIELAAERAKVSVLMREKRELEEGIEAEIERRVRARQGSAAPAAAAAAAPPAAAPPPAAPAAPAQAELHLLTSNVLDTAVTATSEEGGSNWSKLLAVTTGDLCSASAEGERVHGDADEEVRHMLHESVQVHACPAYTHTHIYIYIRERCTVYCALCTCSSRPPCLCTNPSNRVRNNIDDAVVPSFAGDQTCIACAYNRRSLVRPLYINRPTSQPARAPPL